MTDYWSKQKQLQEVYDRATSDSGVSWHEEYLKEKEKRIEIQYKYELLTYKIRELVIEHANDTDDRVRRARFKEIMDKQEYDKKKGTCYFAPGKVYPAKDFGAGLIPVQHKMKPEPILDWDDERMDIIGQNGNTGEHYDEVEKEGM